MKGRLIGLGAILAVVALALTAHRYGLVQSVVGTSNGTLAHCALATFVHSHPEARTHRFCDMCIRPVVCCDYHHIFLAHGLLVEFWTLRDTLAVSSALIAVFQVVACVFMCACACACVKICRQWQLFNYYQQHG